MPLYMLLTKAQPNENNGRPGAQEPLQVCYAHLFHLQSSKFMMTLQLKFEYFVFFSTSVTKIIQICFPCFVCIHHLLVLPGLTSSFWWILRIAIGCCLPCNEAIL